MVPQRGLFCGQENGPSEEPVWLLFFFLSAPFTTSFRVKWSSIGHADIDSNLVHCILHVIPND